jgi:hypothetical protein
MNDIRTTPLNFPHTEIELVNQCKAIYGGVSWPTKRPGFAVIVAMLFDKHYDNHDMYLLAEYESFDTRKIVRQCGAMDKQYKPLMWIGDDKNSAADKFINEMMKDVKSYPGVKTRSFFVCSTLMFEIVQLYSYILPKLKELLELEHRVLFLKESNIVNYLASIEQEEIESLKLGDYPAIEALAFAVIEMREHSPVEEKLIERDRVGYRHTKKRPTSPMVMA